MTGHYQPIPNPYIVGNPIEDSRMFFGREDDFEYIRKKITGGKKGAMLVLCGTRRSGKTSILFQVKRGRLGEGFVPVLIDMQSMTVRDDAEFLSTLAKEIITAINDPTLSFERDFLPHVARNPFTAFQDLITSLHTRLRGKKLVLMFDEYELFETHIDKGRFSTDILHLLANWMEHKEGVFIIFTGSDKLETRNEVYWEHFLGKSLHRRISFLSHRDTARLIQEPLRDVVSYDRGVTEAIWELTAGQPFYTQVICQSLIDHLNEHRRNTVTRKDLQEVLGEIIENPLPQMIFTWSSFEPLEKLALSILAELYQKEDAHVSIGRVLSYPTDENLGFDIAPIPLRESIERLFHADLLTKSGEGESYRFKMDLWRHWTTRMHSIF